MATGFMSGLFRSRDVHVLSLAGRREQTCLNPSSQTVGVLPDEFKLKPRITRYTEEARLSPLPLPPAQPQRADALLQIHNIIGPLGPAPPNHHPLPINSPRPRTLPLIPQHHPFGLGLPDRRPPPNPLRDLVAQPPLLAPPLELGGGVEDGPEGRGAEAPCRVEGEVVVVEDGDGPGAAEEVEPFLSGGG